MSKEKREGQRGREKPRRRSQRESARKDRVGQRQGNKIRRGEGHGREGRGI